MSIEIEDVEAVIKANNDNLLASFKGLLEQTVSQIKRSNEESAESQMKEIKRLKFNSLLRKTKGLEDRHNSGVVLSSVNIDASSLPSQSELGSAIDSNPSVAAFADSFLVDFFKDSGSLAVDLTYSSVRGRLRKFVVFWRTLEVSQFFLNVIMQGYKIPFLQLPTPFAKRNNTSARENSDFVSQAVSDLLRLDLIA